MIRDDLPAPTLDLTKVVTGPASETGPPRRLRVLAAIGLAAMILPPASAVATGTKLDVPVMEPAGDGQMASCGSSVVSGLRADGDGFLAVRSGPGVRYRKLAELHNGDEVFVYSAGPRWAGIVYRTPQVQCASAIPYPHPVAYENRGWVDRRWLRDIAG